MVGICDEDGDWPETSPIENAVTQASDILNVAILLGSEAQPERLMRAIHEAYELLRPYRAIIL